MAIHYTGTPPAGQSDFAFKCHRSTASAQQPTTIIYPVNDIQFYGTTGNTFATVGTDGTITFWDKQLRQRLKLQQTGSVPVQCCAFNASSQLFAYALSYDWSMVRVDGSGGGCGGGGRPGC